MAQPRRSARLRGLRRDLAAVAERDPAARSGLEVALLYPGLHALCMHRISHWLWSRRAFFAARALSQAARWATGIEIHPGAKIGQGVFVDHGAGVVIGETAEVGDDVTIYQGVTLGGTSLAHGKRHPTIGDRVVIGAGAKILGAVTVGHDSRVGANAVLLRSVENHAVVVGVPGQVISSRPPAADRPTNLGDEGPPQSDPVGTTVQALMLRVEHLERLLTGRAEPAALRMSDVGVWKDADFSI